MNSVSIFCTFFYISTHLRQLWDHIIILNWKCLSESKKNTRSSSKFNLNFMSLCNKKSCQFWKMKLNYLLITVIFLCFKKCRNSFVSLERITWCTGSHHWHSGWTWRQSGYWRMGQIRRKILINHFFGNQIRFVL